MSKTIYQETLEYLDQLFPGKILLSVQEVATVLGVSEKYIYSMTGRRSEKEPPFPIVRVGRHLKLRKHDLARHVTSL